jgi:hypothetical protein
LKQIEAGEISYGGKVDVSLLGDDHPGIEMNGVPKGLRLEASVDVVVAYKVNLIATSAEPRTIPRGETLKMTYEIECSENVSKGIWLGAILSRQHATALTSEDKPISLTKGKNSYQRDFTIAKDAPLGEQMLSPSIWRGIAGDSSKSKWSAGGPAIPITIVE